MGMFWSRKETGEKWDGQWPGSLRRLRGAAAEVGELWGQVGGGAFMLSDCVAEWKELGMARELARRGVERQ